MSEVIINTPRREDMQDIAKAIRSLGGNAGNAAVLDATYTAMLDGENTSRIFRLWWPLSGENGDNRYARLCRWFRMLSNAWSDQVYTLRGPDWRVSGGLTELTPMADLAKKSKARVWTDMETPEAEWLDEDPMCWYIRGNALSLKDGTMDVLAVEGADSAFDVTGNLAPVYTFSNALWIASYTDGQYEYKTFATANLGGMRPWACDVAPDGSKREMTWHATFGGSLTEDGKLTSGVGNRPAWRVAASTGLSYARKWDAYEGVYSDTDADWLLDVWQLRHWETENSGTLEGCTNYNYQYTVAFPEEQVTWVTLSKANGDHLLAGSEVEIGSHPEGTSNDRNTGTDYDICAAAKVVRVEAVTIDEVAYDRIHLDATDPFDVPATAYLSTMPWSTGSTEAVPWHKDGSINSCTDGRSPARIAGVEVLDGAYALGLDPLWVSTWNEAAEDGLKGRYHVWECRDSEKQSSAVTNYTDTGIEFTHTTSGWSYIKHHLRTKTGLLIPEAVGGSASTYLKSAFAFDGSSGVRAPWRFGLLYSGGSAGLACASGLIVPGSAGWYGRPRLSGSGKKRGEWQGATAA